MSVLPPPGPSPHDSPSPTGGGHAAREPHLHPEHFVLAQEVARRPLASRRRRLFAILVDLALVALLAEILSSLRLLGSALLALFVYWVLARLWPSWEARRSWRVSIALVVWLGASTLGQFLPGADASARKEQEQEATDEQLEEGLEVLEAAIEAELGAADGTATVQSQAKQLAALRTRNEQLRERVEQMEDELEEARAQHGVLHFVQGSLRELGLGIGWSYVYFIAFWSLWNGYTPGKRLFGIRVLRIDGKPMSTWRAWERFHGYAASMITGLLGFLQVLWDPSRQCLHDKVAETVVVRVR